MDWQTIRNRFMRDIGGDPPGAALEDELIQAYTEYADAVERSIEKITLAHKAGKIRSPWGALKHEVGKATEAARNPTHDRSSSKTKAVARAEQWMRNAGLHYDAQHETEAELYGERGRLRDHPDTRPHMLELWQELRPLGVISDQQAIERGQRYRELRAKLAAAKPVENQAEREARLKTIAGAKGADTTPLTR